MCPLWDSPSLPMSNLTVCKSSCPLTLGMSPDQIYREQLALFSGGSPGKRCEKWAQCHLCEMAWRPVCLMCLGAPPGTLRSLSTPPNSACLLTSTFSFSPQSLWTHKTLKLIHLITLTNSLCLSPCHSIGRPDHTSFYQLQDAAVRCHRSHCRWMVSLEDAGPAQSLSCHEVLTGTGCS
jgi:hypothetical protein